MGYRIKEIREEKKMTQEDLAKATGLTRTTISLLETGATKSASSKTLLRIANALGTTIDSLFFQENVFRFQVSMDNIQFLMKI